MRELHREIFTIAGVLNFVIPPTKICDVHFLNATSVARKEMLGQVSEEKNIVRNVESYVVWDVAIFERRNLFTLFRLVNLFFW